MSAEKELWQLKAHNSIYNVDTITLQQWLAEGRIKPTDKVKKSGWEWLEIACVPAIYQLKTSPPLNNVPLPYPIAPQPSELATDRQALAKNPIFYRPEYLAAVLNARCNNHADIPPNHICPECGGGFCNSCVQVVAPAPASCLVCGTLCRDYKEVAKKAQIAQEKRSELGWVDIKKAFIYPTTMDLAPIIAFALFLSLGIFGFTIPFVLIIDGAILYYYINHTIRDTIAGEGEGLKEYPFLSFFSELAPSVKLMLAATLITLGPLGIITFSKLAFLQYLWPLALVWAVGYYPITMLVIGSTEGFVDIINPVIGLKAVKHLGTAFYKVFGCYLAIFVPIMCFLGLGVLLMAEFDSIGILRWVLFLGMFVAIPFFYSSLVLAYIIGRALFKQE